MTSSIVPLVSVLISVYNHELYVRKCLDSIVENNYPNYEILVIDDGSKDKSSTIIKEWMNDYPLIPIYFKSRENKGLTKTLNELIKLSKGDFICLLASDDYLLPNGISNRVDYLLQYPDKAAVFADSIVVDGNDNSMLDSGIALYNGNIKYLKNEKLLAYELTFHWCAPGPVFMARRTIYEQIGFYDENLLAEDFDFYLRLLSRNLLGFIDCKVSAYRVHQTNTVKAHVKAPVVLHSIFIKTISNNINNFTGLIYYRLKGLLLVHKCKLYKSQKKSTILAVCYWLLGQSYCKACALAYLWLKRKNSF